MYKIKLEKRTGKDEKKAQGKEALIREILFRK
jgi:hypothetical protein